MPNYRHILVGLDLSSDCQWVLDRAASLSADPAQDLTLVHVIEPLTFAYGGDIPMDLSEVQEQLREQAAKHLANLAKPLGIPPARQQVLVGQPASEMHRLAEEQPADLIVVGSHGRHGLALLLGSTANAVLHGADCDILAVRIPSE